MTQSINFYKIIYKTKVYEESKRDTKANSKANCHS